MSDRELVIDMALTCSQWRAQTLLLYMDGDSGTWRLILQDDGMAEGEADLSLAELTALRDRLTAVLDDIARDPHAFNAEARKTWE